MGQQRNKHAVHFHRSYLLATTCSLRYIAVANSKPHLLRRALQKGAAPRLEKYGSAVGCFAGVRVVSSREHMAKARGVARHAEVQEYMDFDPEVLVLTPEPARKEFGFQTSGRIG